MNILQLLTINKKIELTKLKTSLSSYGLQPQEWSVVKYQGLVYKIINKNEPDFYFKGVVKFKYGKKIWSSIHLSGI